MKAKIYTKKGDKGQTSLVGGACVNKDNPRVEAYGSLDELNSALGVVRSHLNQLPDEAFRHRVERQLQAIQNSLFDIGSHFACESEEWQKRLPNLPDTAIGELEKTMDEWEGELPLLREFILPGGSPLAAHCHVARAACRRAEREAVGLSRAAPLAPDHLIYLNRLSDWLFLLARKCNQVLGLKDLTWSKS